MRPFIWLYYGTLLIFGIFAVIFPQATILIQLEMGTLYTRFWVLADLCGTTLAMVGLALRRGGTTLAEMSTPLLRRGWLGLLMQLGGHTAMVPVLLIFEISAVRSPYFWWVVIAVFALAAYVMGCTLLALQCLRKLQRGRQLLKAARK